MKRKGLLKTVLLLCALVAGSGSVWAGDITATLTGSAMLESSSPSTSYAEHNTGITDDEGNIYKGRWTYQKSGSNYYQMIQMKKVESSNSSRIVLPTFDGPIKSITITATDANSTSSSGTGAKTTLLIVDGTTYTSSYASNTDNQVLTYGSSSSETNSYVFDFTTLENSYDGTDLYICSKDGGIRIWSIVVVYTETDYYNVIYDYNDGVTANKTVQVNKSSASSYTLEAAPSRTDFSFGGWNDGTDTYSASAAYPLTGSVTFTAQWSFVGEPTVYNRSSRSDMATGAQYIMGGVKDSNWGFASGITGSNSYIDASALESYSTIDAAQASLTCETPLVITLEETADGWYMKDAEGHKLGLYGDKKVGWDKGDMTWTLGGESDAIPTFSAKYGSDDYTLYYNAGSTRFTAYKSSQQDVYFYRLDDGKDVYTLTLDFNDGVTDAETHRVLEGATYTLFAPTRDGYVFAGWNTKEDGTGTSYPADDYTMPEAATTLYAQWSTSVPATISSVNWATFSSPYALDFKDFTDANAYMVTDASGETLTLTKVTGTVPDNTGLLISCTASATVNIPVTASSTTDVSANKLVAGTGVAVNASDKYVLVARDGKAVFAPTNVNAATVAVGKAYLDLEGVSLARGFVLDESETTGITSMHNSQFIMHNGIFDLQGRRVSQPTKGLYIVNGKKVIIK